MENKEVGLGDDQLKDKKPNAPEPNDGKDNPTGAGKAPEEIKFEDLPPEVQKFVDRERLRASTTAREKAKREALNDPDIKNAIKAELEAEATLTAEQKVERRLKEAQTIENRALAREKLVNGGFVGDALEEILSLVVSDDVEATNAKVDKFLNVVKNAVESESERRTREALRKTPKPVVNSTNTKEFKDMGFEERMKLRETDPQRYNAEMEKLRVKI